MKFNLVVCAGAPSAKWLANLHPEEDLANIRRLIKCLSGVYAKLFVLISTVDVYPIPYNVNEKTRITTTALHPYGRNRLLLEKFIKGHFPNHTIVRLPGLFGTGLKKNFIYDLLEKKNLELTDHRSIFQFYYLNNIWADIQIALKNRLKLINFATEPLRAQTVASKIFGLKIKSIRPTPPANYNMKTIFAELYHRSGEYLYSKEEVLEDLQKFVKRNV